ncbi:MAG TPA: hypothetical protein VM282_07290 [Acidimicrobiales bacterium]|nr:hypothetical protein [Acidimicrobiales bacterium]
MRRTVRHWTVKFGLSALVMATAVAACSGGDDDGSTKSLGPLRFAPLPPPPLPIAANSVVDNADTVLALGGGRLFRFDPWTPGAIWVERERDLPSAKSRLVSWNDRVWYLTNDRGRLELASVALSDEHRSDTRTVSGATDASLAIVAARDAIYVFGTDGGFRIDRDGEYFEFPGPPDRRAVSDWSTAELVELSDGSIVVVDGQRLRWIFEPDLARWREPAGDLGQREIRSMAASDDGAYLLAGSPSQILRLVAANSFAPVSSPLGPGCDTASLYPTDLGLALVSCGTVILVDDAGTHSVVAPEGTTIVRGPRGRPLAVRRDAGEVYLLEFTQ